jgi:hypothetical protein
MSSLATPTQSSESAKRHQLDALKQELQKRQQAVGQSTETDLNKSRHQRWKGLAHQIDADIERLNQVNRTYSSLYRKAVRREDTLVAQIQQLQKELEVKFGLPLARHAENADSEAQPKEPREYQTLNPYKLHKPASDVATSTHEHQHVQSPTPSIHQPRPK